MMYTVSELETAHLHLRPIGGSDYQYLVDLHQVASRTTYDDVERFETPEEWREHLEGLLASSMTGWVVEDKSSGVSYGVLYVTHVVPGVCANLNPVSDVGALKDMEPKTEDGKRLRVMDEAAAAAAPYLFDRFGLQRIGGVFGSNNVPAIKFCERLGMRREGVLRRASKVNGKAVDLHVFSLVVEEVG